MARAAPARVIPVAPSSRPIGDAIVGVIAWSAGSGRAQCGALTQAIWLGPQRGWIDGVLSGWAAGGR